MDVAVPRNGIDVLVVGAGLSGLSVAFRLARAGLQVEMLEAAARPGGVIGSRRRDGVLIESGPNSALDTSPLIGGLLQDAGIAEERLDASKIADRRYILRGGALLPMPTSPPAFLGTRLFSWRTKLGLVREPFIARAPAGVEESVADFVRRRLGAEFLDYAIEPFVAGIYAGDPELLSVAAAFPRLAALEQKYGSLIRGLILGARERRRNAEKAKNTAGSFSFREGMQTLTDALARGVGIERIRCGVRVAAIQRESNGLFTIEAAADGERFTRAARAVVLAAPAYEAARLVQSLAPATTAALGEIVYPPVASVVSAFRREDVAHPLDGFGFLAPKKERPPVLGTLFSSSMFSGRAPKDVVALTTFVGGRRNPELAQDDPAQIATTVRGSLRDYLGAGTPQWQEVTRWPRAIPQYTFGHLQRIATVESAERALPGLFFCANYRGGVSVGDCIKSTHAIAEQVAAHLGQRLPVNQSAS
jgi:oxygen-dependent protoporphyrinogen oxidase